MGCSCGSKAGKVTYTHIGPTGKKKSYATQVEAQAAAIREGGRVVEKA